MAAKEKNELAPITERFAALAKPTDIAEALEVNFGADPTQSASMRWTDLERVRFLAGGAEGYEVVDPLLGSSETVKEVVALPVFLKHTRAFYGPWRGDELGGAPDCSSSDGVTGRGVIDREEDACVRKCATCPMAQWESGAKGRGQACKSQAVLFLLREGASSESLLPSAMQVTPSSLKHLRKLLLALSARGLPYYACELKLGTEKEKNPGGQTYSRIKAAVHRKLSDEERLQARDYYLAMQAQFGQLSFTDLDETERTVVREVTRKAAHVEQHEVMTEDEIPF